MTEKHFINPLDNYEPCIGSWLWLMEDTRRQTLDTIRGLDDEIVNWVTPDNRHSIGTLLYHLAAVEMSWVYDEIFEEASFPFEVDALLNYDFREDGMVLTSVIKESLRQHLNRLKICRRYFLSAFQGMSLEEFHRPRIMDDYELTTEWVFHQLMQHEAEHRGQIREIRKLAELALGRALKK